MKHRFLWVTWTSAFVLSLLAGYGVVEGLVRDGHIGQPVIRVCLQRQGSYALAFRVWGKSDYVLWLSALTQEPAPAGLRPDAALEVVLRSPDGSVKLHQIFDRPALDFRSGQYAAVRLAEATLDGWPWQQWKLEANVVRPDLRFGAIETDLKLWKRGAEVGMGGLLNYVLVIPAVLFALIGLGTAVRLSMHGHPAPLFCTVPLLVLIVVLFVA